MSEILWEDHFRAWAYGHVDELDFQQAIVPTRVQELIATAYPAETAAQKLFNEQLSMPLDLPHITVTPGGLVASGGWCVPSETLYDFSRPLTKKELRDLKKARKKWVEVKLGSHGYVDPDGGKMEMTPEQARKLAKTLVKKAKRAERHR